MKAFSITIDTTVLKKNYCYKCGTRLNSLKQKRVVKKDDPDYPDYKEHLPRNLNRTRLDLLTGILTVKKTLGNPDIDVIHYDLICPCCGQGLTADEQHIVRKIQKKLNKNILHESELLSLTDWAKTKIKLQHKAGNILWTSFVIGLSLLIFFVTR